MTKSKSLRETVKRSEINSFEKKGHTNKSKKKTVERESR